MPPIKIDIIATVKKLITTNISAKVKEVTGGVAGEAKKGGVGGGMNIGNLIGGPLGKIISAIEGLLAGVTVVTALITAGLGLLLFLKPVQQGLDFIVGIVTLIFLYFMKLVKWAVGIFDKVSVLFSAMIDAIAIWINELPGKIWGYIKSIWTWLKEKFPFIEKIVAFILKVWEELKAFLADPIGYIKEKLTLLKDKLAELVTKTVEIAKTLWARLKAKIIDLKDKFIAKVIELKDTFVEKVVELKDAFVDKLIEVWDKIVELKDAIVALPLQIWDYIKGLATLIGDAILGVLPSWAGGTKEDDFISRPGQSPVSFSPDDTIIGVKDTSSLGGGGGGNTYNFYGVTSDEMISFIKRDLGVEMNASGRF